MRVVRDSLLMQKKPDIKEGYIIENIFKMTCFPLVV